jgi:putative membrane protein
VLKPVLIFYYKRAQLIWHRILMFWVLKNNCMKKNYVAAALIASASILWACGGNDKKDGGSTTTSETTTGTTDANTTAAAAPLDTMDQNFAMTAASSDMLEIQSSNMAMQNASSDRVKNFATTMIRDHGQTSSQLKTIATGKGITLPTDLLPPHKTMLDGLQGKTGKDFDKAYTAMQVTAHQQAVSLFDRASNNLKDADMKNFATQHLPHLRMHLDSAQAIK